MLEVYEVFDASTEELVAVLRDVQQLLRTASGAELAKLTQLHQVVTQELEERGCSNNLYLQLAPLVPTPAPAPAASIQQELQHLVSAGQALAAKASGSPAPAVAAATVTAPAPAAHSTLGHAPAPLSAAAAPASGQQHTPPYSAAKQLAHKPATPVASGAAPSHGPAAPVPAPHNAPAVGHAAAAAAAAAPRPGALAPAAPSVRAVSPVTPKTVVASATSGPAAAPAPVLAACPTTPKAAAQPAAAAPAAASAPTSSASTPKAAPAAAPAAVAPGSHAALLYQKYDMRQGSAAVQPAGSTTRPSGPASSKGEPAGTSSDEDVGGGQELQHHAPGAEVSTASMASSTAPPAAPTKPMTAWEAALAAFQMEQKRLRKARKAVKKGPKDSKPQPKKFVYEAAAAGAKPPAGAAPAAGRGGARSSSTGEPGSAMPPAPRAEGSQQGHSHLVGQASTGSVVLAAAAAATTAASPLGLRAAAAGSAAAGGAGAGARPASGTAAAGLPGKPAAAAASQAAGTAAGAAGGAAPPRVPSAAAHAAGSVAKPAGAPAAATAAAATAATARATAPPPAKAARLLGDDDDMVPEELTAAAHAGFETEVVRRAPSEPDSVKTDEESQDLISAATREAAAAVAALAKAAAAHDSDSEPESILSDSSSCSDRSYSSSSGDDTRAGPASRGAPYHASGAGGAVGRRSSSAASGGAAAAAVQQRQQHHSYGYGRPDEAQTVDTDSGCSSDEGADASEEARRREAAKRLAATGASSYAGMGPSSRAAVNAEPIKVDRWSDWDLADSSDALSAWATNREDDPMAAAGGPLQQPKRPTGQAPPQSLMAGPVGVHGARPAPGTGLGGAGPGGTKRPVSATAPSPSRLAAATGAGSQPPHAQPRGVGSTGHPQPVSGSGCSTSDEDDSPPKGDSARRSAAPRPAAAGAATPAAAAASMPRSGYVPAGSAAAALPSSASSSGPSTPLHAPGGPARRPPVAPSPLSASSNAPQQPATQALAGGASTSSSRTGAVAGASSAPPGAAGPLVAVGPNGRSASPAPAASSLQGKGAAYLAHYGAFHEVLSLCYTALPAMVDSIAAAAAAAAGQSPSRPASRGGPGGSVATPALIAAALSGADLMDRYQGMLSRAEGWLEKLRQAQPPPPGSAGRGAGANGSVGKATATSIAPPPSPPPPSGPSGLDQVAVTPGTRTADGRLRRFYSVIDDTAHPEVREVMRLAMALLGESWGEDPVDQITEQARPEGAPGVPGGGLGDTTSRPSTSAGMRQGGGRLGTCHMWNLMWSWSVKVRVPWSELLVWQRVNHFLEAKQLTRKDLLKKHLVRYQVMHGGGRGGAYFGFMPTTFVLPKESAAFEDAFVKALHGVEASVVQPMGLNVWIQKPVGLSRGRGISLMTSPRQLNVDEPMVVQRYVTDPLLLRGHKFDLRLYVLVASFKPLEAWLYREGFARFATLPYSLQEESFGNTLVHLTNSSVHKQRAEAGLLPDFLKSADPPGGSKTSLATLQRLLAGSGVDWAVVWERCTQVATAALFAAQDAIPHAPNSFELFGFDMMIDTSLKVWLLEVNSSPSMGLDTPLDRIIKPRLLADAVALLDPMPFDRDALAAVLRMRSGGGRGGPRRGSSGLMAGTVSEERVHCCADLQAVLHGSMPRRYGEQPRCVGGFTTCLAPSPFHDKLLKLKRPLP